MLSTQIDGRTRDLHDSRRGLKALAAMVLGLALCFALVAFAPPEVPSDAVAAAAFPVQGDQIPIFVADNTKHLPEVAYNWRHDEYLVVWHNKWSDGHRNIYGRRVSGHGEILDLFTIATGAYDNAQPDVAYDPDFDRYLVVWIHDFDGTGSDWDVYGRFIPWDGPDEHLDDFPICTWSSDQRNPRVVYNENPAWLEFLVVWWTTSTNNVRAYVSGQRVYAHDGSFPIGPFTIAEDPVDDYLNPDVAYNLARNEYLVVYEKNSYDIHATRLEANGNILGGGQINIATWPDSERLPTVAACRTANQYFVAWQSLQNSTQDDIYGRFVEGDGTIADVLHVSDFAAHEVQADISCNAESDRYIIV